MKRYITRILAIVLAIVVGVTTLFVSEKVVAANNVTINFIDPILYEYVLEALNKNSDITVISSDDNNKSIVWSQEDINLVKALHIYSSDEVIYNLTGLEKFTELTRLIINDYSYGTDVTNEVYFSDLTPIKELKNLRELELDGCSASDLSAISGLTNLRSLAIIGAKGIDISEIENLTNIISLELILCDLKSESLSHISKLTNLESLVLGGATIIGDGEGNKITDISELQNLKKLRTLQLANNEITDITPLKNLTDLQTLTLRCNPITDISPLENLTKLQVLQLGRIGYASRDEGVPIDGKIDVLKNLTNLYNLQLSNCGITDISALSGLDKLKTLDLTYNSIVDFSPIADKNIDSLDLWAQDYVYTTKTGQIFEVPQEFLNAVYDNTSIDYDEDNEFSYSGCTPVNDGKGVIVGEGEFNAYICIKNPKYAYSKMITFDVIDENPPELNVYYTDQNLTNDDVVPLPGSNTTLILLSPKPKLFLNNSLYSSFIS